MDKAQLTGEIYQIVFVASCIYFGIIAALFTIRAVQRIVYHKDANIKFKLFERILIVFATAIIISYLF